MSESNRVPLRLFAANNIYTRREKAHIERLSFSYQIVQHTLIVAVLNPSTIFQPSVSYNGLTSQARCDARDPLALSQET